MGGLLAAVSSLPIPSPNAVLPTTAARPTAGTVPIIIISGVANPFAWDVHRRWLLRRTWGKFLIMIMGPSSRERGLRASEDWDAQSRKKF